MKSRTFLMFDLDGTLVDSLQDIVSSMNLLLAEQNLASLDAATLRPFIGRGVGYLVTSAVRAAGGSADGILEETIRQYREIYAEHALDSSVPYPGVRASLEKLGGTQKAVISNKPEAATRSMLEALELADHFVAVAGGDSYEEMKPSPMPLLRLMKEVGVEAEHAWMVGDSVYDIEAGRAAGVRTIAVSYGFQPLNMLKALNPDRIVSAFKEIPDIVTSAGDQSKR